MNNIQNKLPKPNSKLLRLTVSPVYDRGLVLVICRAFIACCCFSRAANMSPKSSCTGVLLFFPAAFDKASCKVNEQNFFLFFCMKVWQFKMTAFVTTLHHCKPTQ